MESTVHQRQLQNTKETRRISDNQQNMPKTPHLPTDKSGALNYEIRLYNNGATYPYIVETPLKPDTGTIPLSHDRSPYPAPPPKLHPVRPPPKPLAYYNCQRTPSLRRPPPSSTKPRPPDARCCLPSHLLSRVVASAAPIRAAVDCNPPVADPPPLSYPDRVTAARCHGQAHHHSGSRRQRRGGCPETYRKGWVAPSPCPETRRLP
jgi:hypothetical protein